MRNARSVSTRCLVALLVLAGVGSVGHAQVLYGSLTGNVTDPSSAAIPAAKVQVANNDTGVTRQAETDARGTTEIMKVAITTDIRICTRYERYATSVGIEKIS